MQISQDGTELPSPPMAKLPIKIMIVASARAHGLTVSEVKGHRKMPNFVRARQAVMWIAVRMEGVTLTKTGMLLGRRDHTTILHGVRVIDTLISERPEVTERLKAIHEEAKRLHSLSLMRAANLALGVTQAPKFDRGAANAPVPLAPLVQYGFPPKAAAKVDLKPTVFLADLPLMGEIPGSERYRAICAAKVVRAINGTEIAA